MTIAHNTEIQKYSMVDTACSKTGSRHHVHCTQYTDTKVQHGGYSLLKDGLSTPCTLHTIQRYQNTAWWIQPAQRRALNTMYITHNTQIPKYSMVDTACSKTGSQHHVHYTQYTDTKVQHGGYSLLKDGLSTPCTLHTIQRYKNTAWWIQPAQRRALDTMYIAHNTQIPKYSMVDTACSKTGSQHHVHYTQYTDTKVQHGGYSLLKDGLSTLCTLHIIHRYQSTAWWIQPAQRRALDTMYIAHNTQIPKYSMVDTACSKTGSQHHVHCTQYRDTKVQHGGYSLLKDGLSTPCTLHTIQRYQSTAWWIQPAQRRALNTMYIAHNTQIPKYSMVDTACSKTGSRHHVHYTQYRDTKVQHGGYSLLKDGLSTPCTLHTIQRYQSTAWWIQPAQRRALDTMYIAHNTQIPKYSMVDTACSKTGSRHHVHYTQYRDTKVQHGGYSLLKDGLSTPCTLHTIQRYQSTAWWIQPAQRRALDTMYIAHNTQIPKYSMVDTACSKTGSQHHVHCTQYRDTKVQHGGYSLLKDRLSTPCTLHTIHRYRNTAWWIQPAQRRALNTMYIAHIHRYRNTAWWIQPAQRRALDTMYIAHNTKWKYYILNIA